MANKILAIILGVMFASAGFCAGYAIADIRGRAVADGLRAERDSAIADRDFYAVAFNERGAELNRVRGDIGQLGQGLSDALSTALGLTNYRRQSQAIIDGVRDAVQGMLRLTGEGTTENTEPAPLADSQ